MAFTKGTSGNPHGREQGSQNKATAAAKERVAAVLAELDTTILTYVGWLNAPERIALWLKLQEYVRPRLQRVAVASEPESGATPGVVTVEIVGTVRPPTTREQDVTAEAT